MWFKKKTLTDLDRAILEHTWNVEKDIWKESQMEKMSRFFRRMRRNTVNAFRELKK